MMWKIWLLLPIIWYGFQLFFQFFAVINNISAAISKGFPAKGEFTIKYCTGDFIVINIFEAFTAFLVAFVTTLCLFLFFSLK